MESVDFIPMKSYAFKVTTNGRAILAACMAQEATLKITRVAVGSGRVEAGVNLADIHKLICYEAEGAVGERRHEDNRLYLTAQYSNRDNPGADTFLLSEFIVYAQDPGTKKETDLIYATLGDYIQAVPPYSENFPAAVWNFPMTLVVSDEIDVAVSAPAGLVTYDDLVEVIGATAIKQQDMMIPTSGWVKGEEDSYPCQLEISMDVGASIIPMLTVLPGSIQHAADCGLAPFAQTVEGALRIWAKRVPGHEIRASLALLRDSSGLYVAGGEGNLLPPATPDTLGGVRVGPGLNVTKDGVLSVDTASEGEVDELLSEVFVPGPEEPPLSDQEGM